jgi:protein-tyrosine-phosphatase
MINDVRKPKASNSWFTLFFVCARASCRSPMAAGFGRKLLPAGVQVEIAGLMPRGRIDPMAIHVMRHKGIDIAHLESRGLARAAAAAADLVVVISTPDEALGPLPFAEKHVKWHVENPLGWPVDIYEDARDEIERQVVRLAEWLNSRVFPEEITPGSGAGSPLAAAQAA